jgi:hypothetical protein
MYSMCPNSKDVRTPSPPPPPPMDVAIKDNIPLEPDLTYKCYPIKVLDQQDRATWKKTIRFYKIQWNDYSEDEATWEHEDYLRSNYPDFLPSR